MNRIPESEARQNIPIRDGSIFLAKPVIRQSSSRDTQGREHPQPVAEGKKTIQRATAVGSLFVIIGWFAFIMLYALFWSNHYGLIQNIIVTMASLAVSWLLIGLIWVFWGKR